MAHTIKISDGSTTINFLSSNYKVLAAGGWSPQVARRRQSTMAGSSPYEDVVETMYIQVASTTGADCLDKLGDLSNLLDQAQAWSKDDSGNTAVYIEYEPPASALANSVKAVITGPPPGRPFLTMPREFGGIQLSDNFVIGTNDDPIILQFVRRGLWLGSTETETQTTGTGNPIILTSSTFTDTAPIPWPYDAYVDFSAGPDVSTGGIYIAFSDSADKLKIVEAESMSDSNFTSTAVTGSSGGNTMRTDTGNSTFILNFGLNSGGVGAMNSTLRTIELFLMVCNNSSTVTFTVTPYLWGTGETKVFTIDASSTNPRMINLGQWSSPVSFASLNAASSTFVITFESSASVTAGNTLDVDYLVIVGRDENTKLINMDGGSYEQRWKIDHRLDSHLSPTAYITNTSNVYQDPGYTTGDTLLCASGNAISAAIFGPKIGYDATDFVIQDSSNNELDIDLSVTRTYGYLTPL